MCSGMFKVVSMLCLKYVSMWKRLIDKESGKRSDKATIQHSAQYWVKIRNLGAVHLSDNDMAKTRVVSKSKFSIFKNLHSVCKMLWFNLQKLTTTC